MRKMTIRDFIDYGGPCLECGKKGILEAFSNQRFSSGMNMVPITIEGDRISINLKTTYNDSIVLLLEPKTHKFSITATDKIAKEYFDDHSVFFTMSCHCFALYQTENLQFDLQTHRIAATRILQEIITVKDERNQYRLFTYYGGGPYPPGQPTSELEVVPLDKLLVRTANPPPAITLPVLPRYKFRSKEHFLNKIKTYLTFS